MAGLLEGLGVIFGTAGAQGAKAYGESVAEQAKQEALSIREENMLRIKDIMERGRQKEQNKFTAGEAEKGRAFAGSEAEKGRAFAGSESEKGRVFTGQQTDKTIAAQASEGAAARAQAVTLLDKQIAAQVAAATISAERAKELTRLTHSLDKESLGAVGKQIRDLSTFIGEDAAAAVIVDSLSGNREKQKAYIDVYTSLIRNKTASGETITPQILEAVREEARTSSGYVPKTVKPAAAEEESPLAAAYKAVNGGKASATKMPLLSSHTQTPFQKSTLKK